MHRGYEGVYWIIMDDSTHMLYEAISLLAYLGREDWSVSADTYCYWLFTGIMRLWHYTHGYYTRVIRHQVRFVDRDVISLVRNIICGS